MIDIVEQLRQGALTHDDYRWEAAAEIERLREVLKNVQHSRVLQGKAIREAVDEIERLRAALERIGYTNAGQSGMTLPECIAAARAALEDKHD